MVEVDCSSIPVGFELGGRCAWLARVCRCNVEFTFSLRGCDVLEEVS